MIQLTPQTRIWVALESCDFRKGIDGMARLCRDVLDQDPFSGAVYVFRSRSGKSLRLLVYDGQGFWLCHKRLSAGRFRSWPTEPGCAALTLLSHQLHVLLYGGDPRTAKGAAIWRPVCTT